MNSWHRAAQTSQGKSGYFLKEEPCRPPGRWERRARAASIHRAASRWRCCQPRRAAAARLLLATPGGAASCRCTWRQLYPRCPELLGTQKLNARLVLHPRALPHSLHVYPQARVGSSYYAASLSTGWGETPPLQPFAACAGNRSLGPRRGLGLRSRESVHPIHFFFKRVYSQR